MLVKIYTTFLFHKCKRVSDVVSYFFITRICVKDVYEHLLDENGTAMLEMMEETRKCQLRINLIVLVAKLYSANACLSHIGLFCVVIRNESACPGEGEGVGK